MVLVHIVWLCETRKKLCELGNAHGRHHRRCRRQIPLYCPLSGNYFHLICLWFIYCGALRHLLAGERACCIQNAVHDGNFIFLSFKWIGLTELDVVKYLVKLCDRKIIMKYFRFSENICKLMRFPIMCTIHIYFVVLIYVMLVCLVETCSILMNADQH